jgi:CBS domain-containing protein
MSERPTAGWCIEPASRSELEETMATQIRAQKQKKGRRITARQPDSLFTQWTVARVMEKDVQFAHQQAKLDVLASMMVEGFGSVPIVNEKEQLVGIVSEFDLLASIEQGQKWSEVTAADVMTRISCTVTPDNDLATLIRVLQAMHRIRVPVVNDIGKLVGIVSRRDIVRAYLNDQKCRS